MRLHRRAVLVTVALCAFLIFGKLTFFSKQIGNERGKDEQNVHQPQAVDHDGPCFYDSSCAAPRILFRIHAETANSPPFACLNDIRLFDGRYLKKGVNLVSLNGSTGDVESTISVDVTQSDGELISWLRTLPPSSIIIGVSFGDVAERVSADARAAFASFGAQKIANWRGSFSYAILGQRGLQQHAHELAVSQSVGNDVHVIEGCFDLPLGIVKAINDTHKPMDIQRIDPEKMAELSVGSRAVDRIVKIGPEWKWCGMKVPCDPDEISMHFFTGEHKDDWPRLCVGGHMIFDEGLNRAGRGLNLVSIEPKTGRVSSAAHFDTYEDDSSELEKWLEDLPLGDIMAVVSFDEASNMLSDMAKRIFYEMGSSMIHRLKFRASWYFIGHKGLAAYSPFEDLSVPSGGNWAKPLKASLCLPKKLDKWRGRGRASNGRVDAYNRPLNLPRRHFCLKHDRHGDFCTEDRIDGLIRPKALSDQSRVGDPVFNMPIVIAAGLSTDSLRICLESLMEQEGLNTQMIIVAYDKEYPENAELASLFHMKSIPVNASAGYNSLILSALSAAFLVFPSATSVAVIEEDVQLSPDWLYYLSQTLPILLSDETIDIVQTFNPNGFLDTSGDESLVYRIGSQPPLYSYVIKREKYEKEMKDSEKCCTVTGRWKLNSSRSLVPDVSRITVAYAILGERRWSDDLFSRPRRASHKGGVLDQNFRTEAGYDHSLAALLAEAPQIPSNTVKCAAWKERIADLANKSNSSSIVVTCDSGKIAATARCFDLYFGHLFITGLYKRVIRFVADSTNVFIVSNVFLSKDIDSILKISVNSSKV